MTNETILKKAIEKAGSKYSWLWSKESPQSTIDDFVKNKYYQVIFSHDFAKAFWGENSWHIKEKGSGVAIPTWEYHIKVMVLKEEPLKYLCQEILLS